MKRNSSDGGKSDGLTLLTLLTLLTTLTRVILRIHGDRLPEDFGVEFSKR